MNLMNLKYSHIYKEININNNIKTVKLIVVLWTTSSLQINLENTVNTDVDFDIGCC
jgi:hypothetical protein